MHSRLILLLIVALCSVTAISAQPTPTPAVKSPSPGGRGFPSAEERARLQELSSADHRAMMDLLGIKKLRPGPNGLAAAGEPNAANYDSTKANPFPDYPGLL